MAKDTKKPGAQNSTNRTPSAKSPSAPNAANETELHKELEAIRHRDPLQEGMLNFVEFLEQNKSLVAGIVVIALLTGVAVVGWDFISARREKSAQEAFYNVEKPFTDKRDKYDQAKYAALGGGKLEDLVKAGTAVVATGDMAKDYGTLVDDLEAFAKGNASTTAGTQAALMAAETRIQYKQPEQALSTLESSVKATKANSLIGALARMATGNALASAGKCDQALKSWEEVMAAKDLSFLHGEAALRAGLCLEKAGDKLKAIEMYRKASGESGKSSSAQTARTLLRALELGT